MAISARGKTVDMVSLAKKHEKDIALGNAGYNARGDKLGKGGKIEKTHEEIVADWYATHTVKKEVENLKSTVEESVEETMDKSVEETMDKSVEETMDKSVEEPVIERAKPTVSMKTLYEDYNSTDEEELNKAFEEMKGE